MTTIINQLRTLTPDRALTQTEARNIAERQATRLLKLSAIDHPAVPATTITNLSRVHARTNPKLKTSARSTWVRGRWHIELNAQDHPLRQRFSLAHELKHILDHPNIDRIYPDHIGRPDNRRAEAICDYFAACLLMPRPWIKAAWTAGHQDPHDLAELFQVSPAAMTYRLNQIGLSEPTQRCAYERAQPLGVTC